MDKLHVNMKRAEDAYAAKRKSDARNDKREASHAAVCHQLHQMRRDSRVEFACTLLRGLIENVFPITGEGKNTYTVILAMKDREPSDMDKFRAALAEYNVTAKEEEVSVRNLPHAYTSNHTWMIAKDELLRVMNDDDVSIAGLHPITTVLMWRINLYDAANKSSD